MDALFPVRHSQFPSPCNGPSVTELFRRLGVGEGKEYALVVAGRTHITYERFCGNRQCSGVRL